MNPITSLCKQKCSSHLKGRNWTILLNVIGRVREQVVQMHKIYKRACSFFCKCKYFNWICFTRNKTSYLLGLVVWYQWINNYWMELNLILGFQYSQCIYWELFSPLLLKSSNFRRHFEHQSLQPFELNVISYNSQMSWCPQDIFIFQCHIQAKS